MYLNIGQLTEYSKKVIHAISMLERKQGALDHQLFSYQQDKKTIFYQLQLDGIEQQQALQLYNTQKNSGIIASTISLLKEINNGKYTAISIEYIEALYDIILQNENTDSFASLQNQFIHREELLQLLHWLNTQLEQKLQHPVIAIGIFYFNINLIQPFKKHNLRMARFLATRLLLNEGYHFLLHLPLEKYFSENIEQYNSCFIINAESYKLMPDWLNFFIEGLAETANSVAFEMLMQNELSDNPTATEQAMPITEDNIPASRDDVKYLNKRQQSIRSYISDKQPVKIGDISDNFPTLSYNTIKKDMQLLVKYSLVKPLGNKKGTVYIV